MAAAIAPVLFTEASLDLQPATSSSILDISTSDATSFASRKRARPNDAHASDEDEYARSNIASEASIFFRSQGKAPRDILWRVLNERKSLELQSVDLLQNRRVAQESLLTFRLHFKNPVRPNGIALVDSKTHDALEVFVLTTANELHTFTLRRDLLLRSSVPTPSEFDPAACFKQYDLSSFRHPFSLWAVSDLSLLISLQDGGLLRLERRAGEGGASWRETSLHDGSWTKSLRGLVSWKGQHTVRWQDQDLSPNTAIALRTSPGNEYIFTISLDHTLKSWNATSGKGGFVLDLLGEERDGARLQKPYLMNPDQTSLLKVVDIPQRPDGDAYYCVLYSPKDHQFKFWAVRDADSQEYGVRDVCKDVKLMAPLDELMGTTVWQLADFEIRPGPGWKETQLWIRVRSGVVSRIFNLVFDLLGTQDDLEYAWKHQWTGVAQGSSSLEQLARSPDFKNLSGRVETNGDHTTLSDDWIAFLLFPGRFDKKNLETALRMYQRAITSKRVGASNNLGRPLSERLRSAITANIGITRTEDGHPDLFRYAAEVAAQWKVFFGLVKHLHQRRIEALSIALSQESGLCWSIRAQQVAPIRRCSESEVYLLNEDILVEQDDDWIMNSMPLADHLPDPLSLSAARLALAARSFRSSLSAAFNRSFEGMASIFALRDAEVDTRPRTRKASPSPLQTLYETCDFPAEIGDEEFSRLTDAVQDLGGLGGIENNVFDLLLSKLTTTSHGHEREMALANYGDKATIRGAHDTLIEGRHVILDILSLVVFMSQDLEADELAKGFKAHELYAALMAMLREFEVLLWLSSNTRSEQVRSRRTSGGDALHAAQIQSTLPPTTILQSIFIGDWSTMAFPEASIPELLTYWSRAWTFGSNLGTQYAEVTAHIMGNLIKHENIDLAYNFMRFLPRNAWTIYMTGRAALAAGDYVLAASSFRQAAGDLAQKASRRVPSISEVDTSNLLSAVQRGYFNQGLPRLFLHIASLFETARLPSHSADFASLALHALDADGEDGLDSSIMDIDNRRRHTHDSPAAMQVDLAIEEIQLLKTSELKEEILGRLFANSLQTQRFQVAFEALVRFTNPAIKHASLTQLLTTLLAASPGALLSLPFPAELASEVDAALHSLASKQLRSSIAPSPMAPQYHQLLYAYRISRENYRGAAKGLHEQLTWLQSLSPDTYEGGRNDHADDDEGAGGGLQREVLDIYLMLINTLACCGRDDGWILAEPAPPSQQKLPHGRTLSNGSVGRTDQQAGKRKVVTLDDVRREYQAELDRRSEIAQGRFALLGGTGEGMDVDFS